MSVGKRKLSAAAGSDVELTAFDTCNFLTETISPAFDPNRFPLRRAFFLNTEKSK
jgi:hypothetical protein